MGYCVLGLDTTACRRGTAVLGSVEGRVVYFASVLTGRSSCHVARCFVCSHDLVVVCLLLTWHVMLRLCPYPAVCFRLLPPVELCTGTQSCMSAHGCAEHTRATRPFARPCSISMDVPQRHGMHGMAASCQGCGCEKGARGHA